MPSLYATHLSVLEAVFQRYPIKRAIEQGCGIHSTPWLVKHATLVVSVEQNPIWAQKAAAHVSPWGCDRWRCFCTTDTGAFEDVLANDAHDLGFDLGFIDGRDERVRAANACIEGRIPIVVFHDSENWRAHAWHELTIPTDWTRYDWKLNGTNKMTGCVSMFDLRGLVVKDHTLDHILTSEEVDVYRDAMRKRYDDWWLHHF